MGKFKRARKSRPQNVLGQEGAVQVAAATTSSVPATQVTRGAGDVEQRSLWRDGMGATAVRSAQLLLILASSVIVFLALSKLSTLIIPILLALIIASAMRPVMVKLQGWGFSSLWATITALLGLVVVFGGVLTMIVNSVRNQMPQLIDQATEGLDAVQEWLTTLPFQITNEQIDGVREAALKFFTSASFGSSALAGLSATGTFLTGMVLMIVVLFFFLKDGPHIWEFMLRPFEGASYDRGRRIGTKSVATLGSYVRGTATVAAIDAIGIGIGLAVLKVPLALPLAVITFLLAFIPLVGATVAGIFAALVALVSNGWVTALIVVGVIILVQQLEGNFLQPKIMGTSLALHPLVILLALTGGTILAGILGALLAVPLTAVLWGILLVWDGADTPARVVRKKARNGFAS